VDRRLGFDTIGNATVIIYDEDPILATDPWVEGSAYFGSWSLQHEVPAEQLEAIARCPYIWVSHGHPDHLSAPCLQALKDKEILLPDHVGGRIARELAEAGYRIRVLPDRVWTLLSPRVRVLCIADYNQDAILLAQVGETLVVNLNDAGERGWGHFVKRVVDRYEDSLLLQLFQFGDTEAINFYDANGEFLDPFGVKRFPLGQEMASRAEALGVKKVVPSSSLHLYQRADSVWANEIRPSLDDYKAGFESRTCQLLPAYVRYDARARSYTTIDPPPVPPRSIDPKTFGDDWDEPLSPVDFQKVEAYFRALEHLPDGMDFLNFRVGDKDNRIEFKRRSLRKGLTFEVPRGSLLKAVEFEVFEDLILGNFMKIRLEGTWPPSKLKPDFNPYLKYGDNGRARTRREVGEYLDTYRRRAPVDFLRHRIPYRMATAFRSHVKVDSPLYRAVKGAWRFTKKSWVFPW